MKKILNNLNKYKYPLIISFIIFLITYSIKLTTYSFGLDTEMYMINKNELLTSWLQINRFSLVALKSIFNFLPFNIYLINWLSVILFFLSTVLTYFNFARIYPKFQDNKKAFIFLCIIGTSPIFLEQLSFTLQSLEITFFLCLFQVGIYFFIKYIENNKLINALFTILITTISIGAYQSFVTLFITETIIILVLKITTNSFKDPKEINRYIIKSIVIFLISISLYFIMTKTIMHIFNLSTNGYLESQIGWLNRGFIKTLIHIIKASILVYFGYIFKHLEYTILNTIIGIILIIQCFKEFKNKKYFNSLTWLGLLICPLIMTFVLGNAEPVRAHFTLPLILAFIVIYFIKESKVEQTLIFICIFIQLATTLSFEYNDYKRFLNDKKMAADIYEQVKYYTSDHAIVFVGNQDSDREGQIFKGEALGVSFFSHYGLSDRASTFMRALGYDLIEDKGYVDKATILVREKEPYPSKEGILITDTHIIIKLS